MPDANDASHTATSSQGTGNRQVMALLKVDPQHPTRLSSRENSKLEYKENFNWGSRAKYAKTMAAFANNAGGFIVFGIRNSPHDIVGLTSDRFNAIDPAQVTEYLNSRFAPELDWEMFRVELAGTQLGVVTVGPATEKPVVCVRGDGQDLREAEIYYRYRGRSERIRYAELRRLISQSQRQEQVAFLKHLRKIVRVGPENVGILDLVSGELAGHRGSLLIDQNLLSQVQFIREGHFAESDEIGMPTLQVLGDVEVVASDSVLPVRTVVTPMAIGQKELMLVFLRQEPPHEPIEYLKQACRENSPNMPVYHFARAAEMGLIQLRALVHSEAPNRKGLLVRLDGAVVNPVGSLQSDTQACMARKEILDILNAGQAEGLLQNGYTRLFEAITHCVRGDPPPALLETLAALVQGQFDDLNSNQRTLCRKAVVHLDEVLNREDVLARDSAAS